MGCHFLLQYSPTKILMWHLTLLFFSQVLWQGLATFNNSHFIWYFTDLNACVNICTTRPYIFVLAYKFTLSNFSLTLPSGTVLTPCYNYSPLVNDSYIFILKWQAQTWIPVTLDQPWHGGSLLAQIVQTLPNLVWHKKHFFGALKVSVIVVTERAVPR